MTRYWNLLLCSRAMLGKGGALRAATSFDEFWHGSLPTRLGFRTFAGASSAFTSVTDTLNTKLDTSTLREGTGTIRMSPPNRDPSIYKPLRSGSDEIRLLTIERCVDPSDQICCTLETVQLSANPDYIALSYVWGDPNITEEIKLHGTPMQVTTNLGVALRKLRGMISLAGSPPRMRFWIDAICINQSSVTEKNYQIPLMGKIYSQAEGIVSWLGEERDDSNLALGFINKWAGAITMAQQRNREEYNINPLMSIMPFIEDPFNERCFQAVNALVSRDYFRRVWIIQELVLAKSRLMICGEVSGYLDDFRRAFSVWMHLTEESKLNYFQRLNFDVNKLLQPLFRHPSIGHIIHLINQRVNASPERPNILELLRTTSKCLSTDPRDKLYGLFGLLDGQELPIQPDYNLTLDELNLSFTKGMIQTWKRSDAISLAGLRSNTLAETKRPTWIPEYLRPDAVRSTWFAVLRMGPSFYAAGDSDAECLIPDSQHLHARGILCGEILDICDPGTDNLLEDSDKQAGLWKWLDLAKPDGEDTYAPTRIPWRQAFFRTLTADSCGPGSGKADFESERAETRFFGRAEGFMTFMRYYSVEAVRSIIVSELQVTNPEAEVVSTNKLLLIDVLPQAIQLEEEQQISTEMMYWVSNSSSTGDAATRSAALEKFCGKANDPNALKWPYGKYACDLNTMNVRAFITTTDAATTGRSFFKTQNGYMGLAPRYAKKGDLICVLLGCSVPVIIRKEGTEYIVVGDTYVCGMMQGEIMEEVEKGRLHVQDFIFA